MKRILFLVQKEFIQVFRDKFMLRLILAMPIIQLLILANAATYEIKNLKIHLIDLDRSHTSKRLIHQIEGSEYFKVTGFSFGNEAALEQIEKDKADLILKIPAGFAKNLARNDNPQLQILINAIDGTKAALANAYINAIIAEFNQNLMAELVPFTPAAAPPSIRIEHRNWFNPTEEYRIFMVPGILVILVTILSMMLSALNIVREKEIGTIEQLNVTTIRKHEFIIGKLIPFGILSLVVLSIGLVVARYLFHTPIEGSLFLLYVFSILYIITTMGLGIVISNISGSQLQAIFTSFFFMIIFILMSGLFTPIESMPDWAQAITKVNPLAYFIKFIRMLLLKGSEFRHVSDLFWAMGIYAVVANVLATASYRKRMG